ncbi:hypothetical protein KC887_03335 [Candidatus Kaiserbacteria bacterium]|nr:hypothetical protein [Candidatus Kaiserbacteria bacterium]
MVALIVKLAVIFQASSICLGVGASTLAISSFLAALYDNQIDPSERRMLGVIYVTLRVAMVSIFITTALIAWFGPQFFGTYMHYLWVLIAVLFVNATAMTKHWIPSKFGPAIQAATWYTLGFMVTIHMFQLFSVSWFAFGLLYAADIVTAYVVVNGYLAWRKRQRV